MSTRALWNKASEGRNALFAPTGRYGGMGADFLYSAVVIEESVEPGLTGIPVLPCIRTSLPYILHCERRGAEALSVPPPAGIRRDGRGHHREAEPGGRFPTCKGEDHCGTGWRRVRHQWLEDLHHQLPRRPVVIVVADRSEGWRQRA